MITLSVWSQNILICLKCLTSYPEVKTPSWCLRPPISLQHLFLMNTRQNINIALKNATETLEAIFNSLEGNKLEDFFWYNFKNQINSYIMSLELFFPGFWWWWNHPEKARWKTEFCNNPNKEPYSQYESELSLCPDLNIQHPRKTYCAGASTTLNHLYIWMFGKNGKAFSEKPNRTPFFELPPDCVEALTNENQ